MKSSKINRAMLLFILRTIVTFCAVFFFSALGWIGAEWVFEGQVHTSVVDFVINVLLAGYLTGGVVNIQNKLLRLKTYEHRKGEFESE